MELWQGRYDRAAMMAEEALAHITAVGQGSGIGMCLMDLGLIAHARGEQVRAAELLGESLAELRRSGHRIFVAECSAGRARSGWRKGSPSGHVPAPPKAWLCTGTSAIGSKPHRARISGGEPLWRRWWTPQGTLDRAVALLKASVGVGRDGGSFYLLLYLAELASVTALRATGDGPPGCSARWTKSALRRRCAATERPRRDGT